MIEDKELRKYFISILTKGKKSNTYKFALARFLLDYSSKLGSDYIEKKMINNEIEVVSFQEIANSFLKYYWHQECRYRIRQNYEVKKPPSAIKEIRKVFGEKYIPKYFEDMRQEKIEKAQNEIKKSVFGKGDKSQVVPRFQKLPRQPERRIFYEYAIKDATQLEIKPEALSFFHRHYVVLMKSVFLEWSKFLEKINTNLPMLIAKVEKEESKRSSLLRYKGNKGIFHKFRNCFYCNTSLDEPVTHVDHFIPWSYIFNNEPWNLVLACRECNLKKSDFLAINPADVDQKSYWCDELIKRNRDYKKDIPELGKSLRKLDAGKGWDIEINHHYRNCREYGFNVKNLP